MYYLHSSDPCPKLTSLDVSYRCTYVSVICKCHINIEQICHIN